MSKQNEFLIPEQFVELEAEHGPKPVEAGRKAFVEPEISAPVDVLEATTFFQTTTSGGTL